MSAKTLMFNLMVILLTSCTASQTQPTTVPVLTKIPRANMPNPAAAYCEQQGYRVEIRTAEDGNQTGYCMFPDGSECDEWAYYRGECGPAKQSGTASATTESPTANTQVLENELLDYCFAYPQGFTQLINDRQVEVVGPHSGLGGLVAGLVWIDAIDSQGRTAQEIADGEVRAFGGKPLRSTVLLGGEEALVLDGMPGQDPIRKVYIVHNGLLYTLNFSPYQSDNENAKAQMETLFASVTSSWVWMSSSESCPVAN